MENASKALIIAGAILLAILLISLGIMIYNQASGVVNNNAMSEVEVQQFNQKFTQYEGERVRGATVNTMLQAVLSNNVSQDGDRKISVKIGNSQVLSTTATSISTKATAGKTYKVECKYSSSGGNEGLVNLIEVTELKATTNTPGTP